MQQLLQNYDLICINEVKTPLPVSMPGYVTFKSKVVGSADRGGTVVCVKNWLSHLVHDMDTSIGDQIWFQLRNIPGVLFGFCYIPPCDSPFYSHDLFAAIQEKLGSRFMQNGYIIIGDMNARFGRSVRDLLTAMDLPNIKDVSYPAIPDDIMVPNDNAELLSSICIENVMLVINNLSWHRKHFPGNKSFKRRDVWISELDTCVASSTLINNLHDFSVIQRNDLPSDHAPITVTVSSTDVDLDSLLARATELGDHAALYGNAGKTGLIRKSLKFDRLNKAKFERCIGQMIVTPNDETIDDFERAITDALYSCSQNSIDTQVQETGVGDVHMGRWERLLEDGDDARVWKAINWKGDFATRGPGDNACPSDEEFKTHFEAVLNPSVGISHEGDVTTDVTIPILDDPISTLEVQHQIRRMKPDKACGPDGLPPGVFSLLPAQWILTITTLFNNIFFSGIYPQSWIRAKGFTIFKKGDRMDPHNYRWISVISNISKLYDMVLSERLGQWFAPFREQAGAQRNRGCLEHIVALRLITDAARRKKFKLYVTFIDFSKAYDLVPRQVLFSVLKRMGCGAVMLAALVAMYRVTESIVGTAVVSATRGVRQGCPTSCPLFILFVNQLIKLMKEKCNPERYIQWLHILALMDDTVLLATTRHSMIEKVKILQEFCQDYGMVINGSKTKFFVVSGDNEDKEPLCANGLVIEHCDAYVYLGSPFTSDGSVSSSIKVHAKNKMCHVLKYVSFLRKNNDVPYIVKKRVFDAALMTSVLYGCESWVGGDVRPVVKLYNWGLKQMLGVRRSTPNQVCYAEAGYPTLPDLIRHKQLKFFSKMWSERSRMNDDPLALAIKLCTDCNTPTGRLVSELVNQIPNISSLSENVRDFVAHSATTRCLVYQEMNPTFETHPIYTTKHSINELHRISFTRFRVSGHSLQIETGRWNRRGRGRLPVEERLCGCGLVQTERHVVEVCPLTTNIRETYNIVHLEDLFADNMPYGTTCKIIHDILALCS